MATAMDRSSFYDGIPYTEDDWREFFTAGFGSGVVAGAQEGAVTAGSGRQVLVAAVKAVVNGGFGASDSQTAINLAANAAGSTRVDLIVVRNNYTANQMELDVVQGTAGAGTPALTDNASMKEIALASVSLTSGYLTAPTPTDLRGFVSPHGPAFASTAGRALYLPSPREGFSAWMRDSNAEARYNGTAWYSPTPVGANSNPGFNVFETTISTAYADLTSVGPLVSIETGTRALVTIGCVAAMPNANYAAIMSFTVGGASAIAAADAQCVWTGTPTGTGISRTVLISTLTPGVNVFQAKYRTLNAGAIASFSQRDISVVGLP